MTEIVVQPTPQGHAMLTPDQLTEKVAAETARREILVGFYQNHLKEDVDYGRLVIGGRQSKPSLFKPGAEKFASMMGLRATFERDTDTWEMAGKVDGMLCYRCQLLDGQDRMVGEGRGVATVAKNQGDVNKAVKMAQKSAMIDAVLRTGGLSDFLTQDLEDMDPKVLVGKSAPAPARTAQNAPGDAPACPTCQSSMRLRNSARGSFWGCTRYPDCKGTKPAVTPGQVELHFPTPTNADIDKLFEYGPQIPPTPDPNDVPF